MLTFAILWVVLAATVTLIAIMRKAPTEVRQETPMQVQESGRTLTLLAVVYGVALLAGFLYVSKFLVSSL